MRLHAAVDGHLLVHGLLATGRHGPHTCLHGAHVPTAHLQSSVRQLSRGLTLLLNLYVSTRITISDRIIPWRHDHRLNSIPDNMMGTRWCWQVACLLSGQHDDVDGWLVCCQDNTMMLTGGFFIVRTTRWCWRVVCLLPGQHYDVDGWLVCCHSTGEKWTS